MAVPPVVYGADVTHPAAGSDRPSFAAVVASMDGWPARFEAEARAQAGREELVADLQGMAAALLRRFRRATGRRPERIVFYRDGVSEGQFGHVLAREVPALRAACAALGAGDAPRITFVVVQKRHNTRLLPGPGGPADRSGNILPGEDVWTRVNMCGSVSGG